MPSDTEVARKAVEDLATELFEIKARAWANSEVDANRERLRRWVDRAVERLRRDVSAAEAEALLRKQKSLQSVITHDPVETIKHRVRGFSAFLATLEEELEKRPNGVLQPANTLPAMGAPEAVPPLRKGLARVFVVHGHDKATLLDVEKLLRNELSVEPIVMADEPNEGLDTIISKFERLARDADAVLVLMTPDDAMQDDQRRARQNVIFELGYFLGMFQPPRPRRIILLHRGTIELPSDIQGVLYLRFHNDPTEVFLKLRRQFEAWELTGAKS